MANEVQKEQIKVMQEAQKNEGKGMTKDEFLKKAAEESKLPEAKQEQKQEKKAIKQKKQVKQKKQETKPKSKKKQIQIVGVKDLEKEFKIPGKTIRRYLRKMEENTKPRGPEPYQWKEGSKELKAIRANLKAIVSRKPSLQ